MERTIEKLRTRQPDGLEVPAHRVNVRSQVGLTFDDVLLVPRHSDIRSRQDTSTETVFSRRIPLNVPIVSSNMDTVTESEMAIVMARLGGIGVIHRFMSAERQADQVRRVKRAEALVVEHPLALRPDATVGDVRAEMARHGVGGVIVTDEGGLVLGIITRRDVMLIKDDATPVSEIMTPRKKLITAPKDTSFEEACAIFIEARVDRSRDR